MLGRDAPTLPMAYFRYIADQIAESGGDVDRWLRSAGLARVDLDDVERRLPFPVVDVLVQGSLTFANEPAMGLLVGERLVAQSHGIVGFAVQSSSSVREALRVFEEFTRLRTGLVRTSLAEGKREVALRFDEAVPLGRVAQPILEAVMLSVKNILDTVSLGACAFVRADLAFPKPAYARLAQDLFRCPVRWSRDATALVLPREALSAKLPCGDPAAFREAARVCERELEKLGADTSTEARVRRLLLEKQNGFPSLEATARLLHTTPRTLHRRLVREGTSFRALVEDVRETLAKEHLRTQRFGTEELAYLLGYSDVANFRRAFRRWTGGPPSSFRG